MKESKVISKIFYGIWEFETVGHFTSIRCNWVGEPVYTSCQKVTVSYGGNTAGESRVLFVDPIDNVTPNSLIKTTEVYTHKEVYINTSSIVLIENYSLATLHYTDKECEAGEIKEALYVIEPNTTLTAFNDFDGRYRELDGRYIRGL